MLEVSFNRAIVLAEKRGVTLEWRMGATREDQMPAASQQRLVREPKERLREQSSIPAGHPTPRDERVPVGSLRKRIDAQISDPVDICTMCGVE